MRPSSLESRLLISPSCGTHQPSSCKCPLISPSCGTHQPSSCKCPWLSWPGCDLGPGLALCKICSNVQCENRN